MRGEELTGRANDYIQLDESPIFKLNTFLIHTLYMSRDELDLSQAKKRSIIIRSTYSESGIGYNSHYPRTEPRGTQARVSIVDMPQGSPESLERGGPKT